MKAANPAFAQLTAKLQQALAFERQGQVAHAKFLYEKILKLQPDHVDALNSLGVIEAQTKNPRRAVQLFGKAIAADPSNAVAYANRALALHGLGQLDAALESYDRALALRPSNAEAYFGRGNVLRDLGRWEEACAGYDEAIAINSRYAEAYANRGFVLKDLHRLDAAVASYDLAIAINPNYVKAYCNRAFTSLLGGDFASGWVDYEWRVKLAGGSSLEGIGKPAQPPLWLGKESLAGKTIVLRCEQGLGDTLQFCRYATLVADRGATVVLEVQKPLKTLIGTLGGVSQVVATGDVLPDSDFQCPLLSLPLAFNTTVDTIPRPVAYLRSDSAKVAVWQTRMGRQTQPRVGLMWSGSPTNYNDRNRSIPLADLIPHLPPGFQYVSLQKEVREIDRRALKSNPIVLNFAADQVDFSDAAALCECMDIVLSVDTSIAHLAGALGKSTWVLLPFNPDWRWLLNRDDSPWYPTATLYRQREPGDWNGVLQDVKSNLMCRSKLHKSGTFP